MSENVKQWPDSIVSGDIRYGKASNYDGFYLADADHGIPTFGSVTDTASLTIRGQHVSVFNYPGQTEAIAAELVRRWNAHNNLLEAAKTVYKWMNGLPVPTTGCTAKMQVLHDAIAKAEARP